MLDFTGAVRKDRVSWVLRWEVCTWFCFATCTHDRNEGNTKSEKMDFIPRKHVWKQERLQVGHRTTHRPAQTDSRGSRALAETGIQTCVQWQCLLLNSWPPTATPCPTRDTTLPPASYKPTASKRYRKYRKCGRKSMASKLFLSTFSPTHVVLQRPEFIYLFF